MSDNQCVVPSRVTNEALLEQLSCLTKQTTALLGQVYQKKCELDAAVAETQKNTAEVRGSSKHITLLNEQLAKLVTDAEQALRDATAIVYGGSFSVVPSAGAAVVADGDGKIRAGWLPNDLVNAVSELEALVIGGVLDGLKDHQLLLDHSEQLSKLTVLLDKLTQSSERYQAALSKQLQQYEHRLDQQAHNLGAVSQDLQNLAMVTGDQDEYLAEVLRGQGQSGVYLTRQYNYTGQKAYQRPFGVNYAALGIHSHWDFNGILGMAEGSSIVDGRFLRRRHTDYQARMPAPVGSDFLQTVPIAYPAVPKDVALLPPDQQLAKMREYFEVAMGKRPVSQVADFAGAFKVCIAYEEQWDEEFSKELSDTFFSGRHVIDASSIQDLMDKVQYFNAGGYKNRRENISYFHSLVQRVDREGNIRLAIRKSRVVMMPVGNLVDYPLQDILSPVDDALTRQRMGMDLDTLMKTRMGRFRIHSRKGSERIYQNSEELIDEMMHKIPGLDGTGAVLRENYHQYGLSDELVEYGDARKPLNSAYYNRKHGMLYNDASRRTKATRGFNDPTLWVAQTSRKEVAPVIAGGEEKRFSRLIPLELVVLTPLHEWNPYGVSDETDNLRWQDYYRNTYGKTEDKPLPGFFRRGGVFYHTPGGFFANTEVPDFDPADTAHPGLFVRCADGVSRKHTASGIPIFLPEIKGVGRFRTRFPIPFMYHEGSHAYAMSQALLEDQKEWSALMVDSITEQLKQEKRLLSIERGE